VNNAAADAHATGRGDQAEAGGEKGSPAHCAPYMKPVSSQHIVQDQPLQSLHVVWCHAFY
jgi:hypothetical protein